MDTVQQKISKTSKIISVILKICFIVAMILAVILFVGIIVINIVEMTLPSAVQDGFNVYFAKNGETVPSTANLSIVFMFALILIIIVALLLFTLHRVFSDIAISYTPFKHEHVARIKKVAFLTLLFCILSSIVDTLEMYLLYNSADAISIQINYVWLILAIVIYSMAYIFDYGCQLQKQSDETL